MGLLDIEAMISITGADLAASRHARQIQTGRARGGRSLLRRTAWTGINVWGKGGCRFDRGTKRLSCPGWADATCDDLGGWGVGGTCQAHQTYQAVMFCY